MKHRHSASSLIETANHKELARLRDRVPAVKSEKTVSANASATLQEETFVHEIIARFIRNADANKGITLSSAELRAFCRYLGGSD